MRPGNGTWLPLIGCAVMTVGQPIRLLAYNQRKATSEGIYEGAFHRPCHGQ